VEPCGAGSYPDQAERRISVAGLDGVLVLRESGLTCNISGTLEATATYTVDGVSSTGVFAGAKGSGQVSVDTTTHAETISGRLKLSPSAG